MDNNTKLIIGAVLGTLVLAVGMAFIFGSDGTSPVNKVYDQGLVLGDAKHVQEAKIASGSATATGSAQNQKVVTVVEFSDFQCPACRSIHPLVKQILEKQGSQVRFVFRNFPLDQHQNAYNAALFAEVAAAQGKYWETVDYLFEYQDDWAEEKNVVESKFVIYAEKLGIKVDNLAEEMKKTEYKQKIDQDRNDGYKLQVDATPTFFVNGEKVMANGLEALITSKMK